VIVAPEHALHHIIEILVGVFVVLELEAVEQLVDVRAGVAPHYGVLGEL